MAAADPSRAVLMVLEATFPPRGGGGAESQVLAIGRRLRERGLAVEVIAPMVADGPQEARGHVEGLEVLRIAYPRVRVLGGLVMLAKLAWLLFARRREYAVIHAHIAHNMATVAALVGRALGKPVVVKLTGMQELNGGILDERPDLPTRLRKAAIRRATWIQATSTRLRQVLLARGFAASQILSLPNGVDVDRFRSIGRDAARRRELCGEARLVGMFVGRLAPEKGHEVLLEAWARVFAGDDGVRLVLVGDGVRRKALEELAARLAIGRQVVFAGHTDDVAPYLAIADFGLLTSLAEGLSNALLEYMAAGLPVVGSRVSGTEDFVVPGRTGWLFEPGDGAGLSACLANAKDAGADVLREMGGRGRQLILDTASLQAVSTRLIECYGISPADRLEAGVPAGGR
jgi:glycosyltransferase involved in cell wall biosynthesis